MPRGVWSAKRERQYEHILENCRSSRKRRSVKTCKRIAAATVNKTRSAHCETKACRAGLGEFSMPEKLALTGCFLVLGVAVVMSRRMLTR